MSESALEVVLTGCDSLNTCLYYLVLLNLRLVILLIFPSCSSQQYIHTSYISLMLSSTIYSYFLYFPHAHLNNIFILLIFPSCCPQQYIHTSYISLMLSSTIYSYSPLYIPHSVLNNIFILLYIHILYRLYIILYRLYINLYRLYIKVS